METLIRGRYSHDYIINRREARDVIGLNIIDIDPSFENKVIDLFKQYQEVMALNIPYHPEHALNGKEEVRAIFNRAIIESTQRTNVFRTERTIKRMYAQQPGIAMPTLGYSEEAHPERWVVDENL